jgi:ABC-type Mn2+/Zn2+ transport system permease subunit
MDWLTEPFTLVAQQRALMAGALAAVALALVGTWVVVRGMTFLGDALVHGVIPGIALATIVGFAPVVGALLAAGVMAAGINYVHRQTHLSEDTGIGLLFVGMLGLGVMVVPSSDPEHLSEILFGDPFGVTTGDLALLVAVVIVVLATSVLLYRSFLVLSFNELKAQLLGLRPRVAHLALVALITLSIVGSFRVVGTLLVFGLLIGPAATAALLVKRVPTMMLTAAAIGAGSVLVGLIISYHANTSGSATIAVVPVALFFVVLAIKSLAGRSPALVSGSG